MPYSRISIIGAPLDLGQGRRGVDMGPSAMRVANLNARLSKIGFEVDDLGNVPVAQPESHPEGQPHAKYLPQITQTCTHLAELVEKQMAAGSCPLVLGGDHSLAVGTVSGRLASYRISGETGALMPIATQAVGQRPAAVLITSLGD